MFRGQDLLTLFLLSLLSVRGDEFGAEDDQIIKTYVEKLGYNFEPHKIETLDGFVLTYHRISTSTWETRCRPGKPRTPILLQHGLGMSSAAFLIPDKGALAYVLADAGYDVWLGNSRGNRYSRDILNWTSHTLNDKESWQFSIQELGVRDLSAAVQYIQVVTEQRGLHYVGHSHGGAYAFALLAFEPAYQPLFGSVITLAPATFLNNLRTNISKPSMAVKSIIDTLTNESVRFESGNRHHMLSSFNELYSTFCKDGNPKCSLALDTVKGTIDKDAWVDILQFQPSRTSTKSVLYVQQQIQNGVTFRKHSYGPEGNKRHYNSAEAPAYNLSAITIPIDIIYTDADVFVSHEDIGHHKTIMRDVTLHKENRVFNHLDFLWGPNIKTIVSAKILKILEGKSSKKLNSTKRTNKNHSIDIGVRSINGKSNKIIGRKNFNNKQKKRISQIKLNYIRVVESLMYYEANTKVNPFYIWLNDEQTDNLEKVKILNDIANILDMKCSNRDTGEMVNATKAIMKERRMLSFVNLLKLPYEKHKSLTCPVNKLGDTTSSEEFKQIVQKLKEYKLELKGVFTFSSLSSNNVSNNEKIRLIIEMIEFLRNKCVGDCRELTKLMNTAFELRERVVQTGSLAQADLVLSGSAFNRSSNFSESNKTLQEQAEESYERILKLLTRYESRTHSRLNYLQLASEKVKNKVRFSMLKNIIRRLNEMCSKQCNDVKDLEREIDNLYILSKKLPNVENLDLTTTSLVLQIRQVNKLASKSLPENSIHPQTERLVTIINKILHFESKKNVAKAYEFLTSSDLSSNEKVNKILERVGYLIVRCVDECVELHTLEKQVKKLPRDGGIYFDGITLICDGRDPQCKVLTESEIETNTTETSLFKADLNKTTIREKLNQIEAIVRNKLLNIMNKTKHKNNQTFPVLSNFMRKTTNSSNSELVLIMLERIRYLKGICSKDCENLNEMEKILQGLNKQIKSSVASNPQIDDAKLIKRDKRDKFQKIVEKLVKYEENIGLSTNISWFVESKNIPEEVLTKVLLDRIRDLKERCKHDCEELFELEIKVKSLDNKSGRLLNNDNQNTKKVPKPVSNAISVKNKPSTYFKKKILSLSKKLREHDYKSKSNLNYSFSEYSNMSDFEAAKLLLERVKQSKEECLENCEYLSQLESEVNELYTLAETPSDVVYISNSSNTSFGNNGRKEITTLKLIEDYYIKLVKKVHYYDLKFGIKPRFDYSILNNPNMSNSRRFHVLFKRLLQLEDKCTSKCKEITELVKEMKKMQYQIKNSEIEQLDLITNTSFQLIRNSSKVQSIYSNPEYHVIKGEYIIILTLLKAYEESIGSNFNFTFLESTQGFSVNKIKILKNRVSYLKTQCNEKCKQIEELEKMIKRFEHRLKRQTTFSADTLELSLPKQTFISWVEENIESKPIIKKVKHFKKHINSSNYFSGRQRSTTLF